MILESLLYECCLIKYSGSIPSELNKLIKLTYLHLSKNLLTGMTMYMNILTIHLLFLLLQNFFFISYVDIDNDIMILESLLYEYCLIKYAGSIPSELDTLSSLSHIALYNNQLEGKHN